MFGINDSKIGIDLEGGIGFMNTVSTLWKSEGEFGFVLLIC